MIALAAIVLVTGCSSGSSGAKRDRLPDVTLPALGGGSDIDLGEVRGPAVVNVWASWCVPCKRELPIYADFAREHAGELDVLGIDFQDTKKAKALAMMRTAEVDFPVAYDLAGEAEAIVLPKLMLIDEDGEVVYSEYVEIESAAQLEEIVAEHLEVTR